MTRNHTRALVLGTVALLVSACAGPGGGITDRIRAANSPFIQEVHFSPSNLAGHPEEVIVYVKSDATDAQIQYVWCTVVVPAGIDQMPPERVDIYRSGTAFLSDVVDGASPVSKPPCP